MPHWLKSDSNKNSTKRVVYTVSWEAILRSTPMCHGERDIPVQFKSPHVLPYSARDEANFWADSMNAVIQANKICCG